jgi:hypothetical protein
MSRRNLLNLEIQSLIRAPYFSLSLLICAAKASGGY